MAQGGTQIFCPFCYEVQVCRAEPPTVLDLPRSQQLEDTTFSDIHWFRRVRACLTCNERFQTAEIDEDFVQELVMLRAFWLGQVRPEAEAASREIAAGANTAEVTVEQARDFIKAAAKWDHPSGAIADAPGHADRIYRHDLGWAIDYGANTFLPGLAVERCLHEMARVFHEIAEGSMLFRQDAMFRLQRVISGCVATYDGEEYSDYYPLEGPWLRFGTQLIDTDDGADHILRWVDPKNLLLRRP